MRATFRAEVMLLLLRRKTVLPTFRKTRCTRSTAPAHNTPFTVTVNAPIRSATTRHMLLPLSATENENTTGLQNDTCGKAIDLPQSTGAPGKEKLHAAVSCSTDRSPLKLNILKKPLLNI
ncbi:MAG: hypothetical protein J6S98_09630 [Lentisphaeria bacterium]|nr:hypothetical protein [Lentisphaeria bacterium]